MEEEGGGSENSSQARASSLDACSRAFFLSDPISEEDLAAVEPEVVRAFDGVLARWEEKGPALLEECRLERKALKERRARKDEELNEQLRKDALVNGEIREYQTKLVEIAKHRNTIVHLGTGTGKTLIALLLIRHFGADGFADNKKHAVFLVPSVALALQQTMAIRANLPYVVETASHRTVQTDRSRNELSRASVLVATHGAYHDLLSYHGDRFRIDDVNLLILDECHNCTGKSPYAQIMTDFYHRAACKPRVLGLTASPLINIKNNLSQEELRKQLESLEAMLDARVASPREFGMDETSFLLQKEAEEETIHFKNDAAAVPRSLPDKTQLDLLKSRRKELNQLDELFKDLGPFIVGVYSRWLRTELKRNTFEHESGEQFENAKRYLEQVSVCCDELCAMDPAKLGRSDKLLALEELLERQTDERPDAVGLVFVERRATAMALNEYFSRRLVAEQKQEVWPNASRIRHPEQETRRYDGQNRDEEVEPTQRQVPDHVSITPTADPSTITGPDTLVGEDDQFMDADSDQDPSEAARNADPVVDAMEVDANDAGTDPMDLDQFGDADSCDDPSRAVHLAVRETSEVSMTEPNNSDQTGLHENHSSTTQVVANIGTPKDASKHYIRCQSLVRRPSNVFRVPQGRGSQEELQQELEKGLDAENNIREVLNSLRKGDTNVLFATSVVEEGVDVRACSFVAAFDPISSMKSYVQMKGRARQEDAKFFAFDIYDAETPSSNALSDHQHKERKVREFLSSRDTSSNPSRPYTADIPFFPESGMPLSTELEAVRKGLYKVAHNRQVSTVSLLSAKSLLNRFVLAQPIDPVVRSSKASLHAHLPAYDRTNSKLCLPAIIADPSLRVVELPSHYIDKSWKDRQNILALIACVRLHKSGLLTDRLLPLSEDDMESNLIALVTEESTTSYLDDQSTVATNAAENEEEIYVYRIIQESDVLDHYRERLRSSHLDLALVASHPLSGIPAFKQQHPTFDEVNFSLAPVLETRCTSEQLGVLSEFFTLVFNARWQRKTRPDTAFRFCRSNESASPGCPCYRVGCVDAEGKLVWDYMKMVVDDGGRSKEKRTEVVRSLSDEECLPAPRLWVPLYDKMAMYIAYAPSGERSDARFPHTTGNEQIHTYQDYFRLKKGVRIPAESQLFEAQCSWFLPSRHSSKSPNDVLQQEEDVQYNGFCRGLFCVRLPKHACFEPPMADAGLYLLSTFLPQFLYYVERCLCAQRLVIHCSRRLPNLGRLLKDLPLADAVSVLSAKSCRENTSYERLEYIGDSVLKLVQTEVILKSTDLRGWIRNLHEGNLTAIRSILGSNKRLLAACKRLGLDRFILTAPLSRGNWTPSPLELFPPANEPHSVDGKICADVVEALLGLAYVHGNYKLAVLVAQELQATIPFEETFVEFSETGENLKPMSSLLRAAENFTEYSFRSSQELVLEAFTHPTALDSPTPSYQRLEWLGDAVLGLAARCWIFRKFPSADPKTMVLMESALVSNETLAFLSLKSGLYKHMIHNDPSLPGRLDWYAWAVEERGRGLWGTDPPKPIADIVESILGAIYIHGGYHDGQQAVEKVLEPVLNLLEEVNAHESILRHPKRSLLEIGGNLTSLTTLEECEYAKEEPSNNGRVWLGKEWGAVHRGGHRSVAIIRCLGTDLISLVDETPSSASNRACAFVLAVLTRRPELLASFQDLRKKVTNSQEEPNADDRSI